MCNHRALLEEWSEVSTSVFPDPYTHQWEFFFLLVLLLESFFLAPLVATQYPCPCLCSPAESFTACQSTTCFLSAQRHKNYLQIVCSQQKKKKLPSVGEKTEGQWVAGLHSRRHGESKKLSNMHLSLSNMPVSAVDCHPPSNCPLYLIMMPCYLTQGPEGHVSGVPCQPATEVWQRKQWPVSWQNTKPCTVMSWNEKVCYSVLQARAGERNGTMSFLLT